MKEESENRSMRLGFHYHIPFRRSNDGNVYVPGYLGRFLDSLAVHCQSLTCFMHSPRADELEQMDYQIESTNITFVDIGLHVSVPRRLLSARDVSDLIHQAAKDLDIMLIRAPTPLLSAVAKAVRPVPTALLLVGDYLAGIDDLPQPRWRKEAIRLWSYWNYRQQLAVARRSLTFVNSHLLYEQYQSLVPNLVETRTTTLSSSDSYERHDTCQQRPIRLLYTGRIDRAKGLFEMIQAVEQLSQQGYDIVLDLVGWPAKGDTIVDELRADAQRRGVDEKIIYHGFKSVGPELFAYYKNADIYVIASQSSEGFPRTIWEAMAHSVPVVATRVGSIPHYLEHEKNALLVDPRNSDQLLTSIRLLMDLGETRRRLIAQGMLLARSNTLEIRAAEITSCLMQYSERAN